MKENPNFFACSNQHSPFHPNIREAEVNYFGQLMTTYLGVYFQTQFEQVFPLLALKINLVHNIKTSLLNIQSHSLLQDGISEVSY